MRAFAVAEVPVCVTLAGGTAEDIRDTVEIDVGTLRVFTGRDDERLAATRGGIDAGSGQT